MKIHTIVVAMVLLFQPLYHYAQKTYQGKVINTYNEPIPDVAIFDTNNSKIEAFTDKNGSFSILLDNPEIKIVRHGYITKIIALNAASSTIILEEYHENLDMVVVTASREKQKRSEIPAAVGLIRPKKLQETKAIGIEQLVNQIPGVYMSTSKASGNEQHFMATRSPITTKSLFLYLEDGIPIRPVAVFNHNALLEMNATTFERIEVIKGPASSMYGSEAIGGSFNFITKNPKKEFGGAVGFQTNDLGIRRLDIETSTTVAEKYGFYIGGHYTQRKNGPVEHSDYEKTAISFKNTNEFSKSLQWENAVTVINYRSDMTGSVSEKNYQSGNYESNQTFTEREALALRFRSTLVKQWDNSDKTSFHFVYRNNKMDQIPSYRIRQNRNQGQLTGTGSGEKNSNAFRSYMGMIQHKIDFNFATSSLIFGSTIDFSPQDYVAEKLDVVVDTNTGKNIDYTTRNGDYLLYYQADILNYAAFAQYEISPFNSFKITGAIRYDGFQYDYDNLIDATAGVSDTQVSYKNWSPKIGFNYSFTNHLGIYGSYANGFTPPQVSSLFRNSNNNNVGDVIFDLKPANFNNYEVGGYYSIPAKLHVDIALYQLDGRNRLISMRDDDGNFVQKNAGKTRSIGIELGTRYTITKNLSIAYNGSFASHKYISFFDNNRDYSNTRMEIAPKYLANITMQYKPLQNLLLALELEQVGKYNTSFEEQAIVGQNSNGEDIFGTATYKGYDIVNFRANYSFKGIELWMQMLNISNALYAVRASYSKWSKENTYNIGNPRAFHFGVRYNL